MKELFRFKNYSIRKKFIVSFLLFLMIPLLALFLWINSSMKQKMIDESCRTNLAVLKQTETFLNNTVEDLIYVSLGVIGSENVQSVLSLPSFSGNQYVLLSDKADYELGTLINSKKFITSLVIYTDSEIVLQLGKFIDIVPQHYHKEMTELKGNIVWSPAHFCEEYAFPTQHEYEVSLYRAINSHNYLNKKLAYEKISIDEDYLCSLYSNIKNDETVDMFIMDENGRIVSSINKDLLDTNMKQADFYQKVCGEKEGYFIKESGIEVVSYYHLDEVDWYIVKIDKIELFDQYAEPELIIRICIFITIVFAILFYGIQRRRIIQPLTELSKNVKEFQEGNYEIGVFSEAKDEIGELNNNFVNMAEYIQDLIEKVYKGKLREKEAELMYLQSQINPHFLYNTLDSLRWMAVKKQQYDLAEQIEALSNHFRHSLNQGQMYTTVELEINHLKDYMTIQKNRFGDRISYEIKVDEDIKTCEVPNLILQPLVENAIVHGLESKLEPGLIEITISIKNEELVYCVEDNGVGIDERIIVKRLTDREDSHNALALDNINQRIKGIYGDAYGLKFESRIGVGTKVTVIMPVMREKNETIDSR